MGWLTENRPKRQRVRKTEIILTNGKPSAVILCIEEEEYEELLERAEDAVDRRRLR